MAQELLDAGVADDGEQQASIKDETVDILEEFDEAGVYEVGDTVWGLLLHTAS